jgi:hypothetical protein
MLPQVAHHSRQLSQQFGNLGFPAPPFEPISSPRRSDRLEPLPFRGGGLYENPPGLGPTYRAVPAGSHVFQRSSLTVGSSG